MIMKVNILKFIFLFFLAAGCSPGGGSYYDDSEYNYNIPAGSKVWLMADKGVVTDDLGRVSIWRDQSGSGNDVIQSVSAAMPRLKSGMIYGKSAVYFDGDNYMSVAGKTVFTHSNSAGFAAFIVFRMEEAGTSQGIFSLVRDDNIKPFILHNLNKSLRFSFLVTPLDADNYYVNSDYGLQKFRIVSCLYTPGTLDMINFKVDGTVKNVMSRSITSTSSTTMFIGKSPVNSSPPYINGYIAEIVMYDRGLTDAEVKQVECYLWHKYNINCAECSY